ncbi:hypothetical protein PAHAL_3G147200 [Panicum hallii]|uniref:Uncharacterized protein n=1 Tax=Panicum hallii TaxID=206008 RepID=A0A2S3H8X3_9POAL|nr:hypothetical protein PAHAL_3G147200 [Panicum hallii]
MRKRIPQEGSCDPIAPKIFHRAPSCDSLDVDYVSENCDVPVTKNRMDEQVSCEFHSERKRDPGKFKNQLTNQGTTRMVGCFPNPPFFKSPSDVSSWDSFFLDAIRVRSQLEPQQGGAPTDLQLLDRRQSLLSLVAPVIKNLHAPGLDEGKGLYFPFVSQGTKTARRGGGGGGGCRCNPPG